MCTPPALGLLFAQLGSCHAVAIAGAEIGAPLDQEVGCTGVSMPSSKHECGVSISQVSRTQQQTSLHKGQALGIQQRFDSIALPTLRVREDFRSEGARVLNLLWRQSIQCPRGAFGASICLSKTVPESASVRRHGWPQGGLPLRVQLRPAWFALGAARQIDAHDIPHEAVQEAETTERTWSFFL